MTGKVLRLMLDLAVGTKDGCVESIFVVGPEQRVNGSESLWFRNER